MFGHAARLAPSPLSRPSCCLCHRPDPLPLPTGVRMNDSERPVAVPEAGSDPDLAQRHADVFIVDDDPNIALLMDDLLAAPDRTLHYAKSGRDALRELRKLTPAVILLDVVLGDMNGFDLAALVRRSGRLLLDAGGELFVLDPADAEFSVLVSRAAQLPGARVVSAPELPTVVAARLSGTMPRG